MGRMGSLGKAYLFHRRDDRGCLPSLTVLASLFWKVCALKRVATLSTDASCTYMAYKNVSRCHSTYSRCNSAAEQLDMLTGRLAFIVLILEVRLACTDLAAHIAGDDDGLKTVRRRMRRRCAIQKSHERSVSANIMTVYSHVTSGGAIIAAALLASGESSAWALYASRKSIPETSGKTVTRISLSRLPVITDRRTSPNWSVAFCTIRSVARFSDTDVCCATLVGHFESLMCRRVMFESLYLLVAREHHVPDRHGRGLELQY